MMDADAPKPHKRNEHNHDGDKDLRYNLKTLRQLKHPTLHCPHCVSIVTIVILCIMGSINAQQVALKVSGTIRKGKKVVLKDIIEGSGYSSVTANSPTIVTNTKSYKQALAVERKPLIEQLEEEIQAITLALSKKDKNKEEYRTLIGSLDIAIRNKHLLSGGVQNINVFVLPSEVMEKNNIIATKDIDQLPSDTSAQTQELIQAPVKHDYTTTTQL